MYTYIRIFISSTAIHPKIDFGPEIASVTLIHKVLKPATEKFATHKVLITTLDQMKSVFAIDNSTLNISMQTKSL